MTKFSTDICPDVTKDNFLKDRILVGTQSILAKAKTFANCSGWLKPIPIHQLHPALAGWQLQQPKKALAK